MENLSYSEIVSTLAFITALGALTWNIVRDFITDRMSLKLNISFGETGNINDSTTGLFADAGSIPKHKFNNIGTLIEIINTGNKPICASLVGGKFKDGKELTMVVANLPKMLHPYEVFSTVTKYNQIFLDNIHNKKIQNLWITDTKNKKWYLSSNSWKRLEETAEYVYQKKHLQVSPNISPYTIS